MTFSIQDTLNKIQQEVNQLSDTPTLDAQVLVAHILGKTRSWVMAHPEIELNTQEQGEIHKAVERLAQGEPLPYIVGHWEFYGLDFELSPAVLIPRPETELLVEQAIQWLKSYPGRRACVDIGTGSGCIGISLAVHITDLQVLLTDISAQALNIARENAEKHHLFERLQFKQADLLDGIPQRFDLICANLPYISTAQLKNLSVAKREPLQALQGGKVGSELIKHFLQQARTRVLPGGLILLEIEASQGDELKSAAKACFPGSEVNIVQDLAGRDRCLRIQYSGLILHLCHQEDWQRAQQQGIYSNPSLEKEGFIHCSQPEQIIQVANRFYLGHNSMIVLWIDPKKLSAEVRWENADGELFPHVYGLINLEAVIGTTLLLPGPAGHFQELQLLR